MVNCVTLCEAYIITVADLIIDFILVLVLATNSVAGRAPRRFVWGLPSPPPRVAQLLLFTQSLRHLLRVTSSLLSQTNLPTPKLQLLAAGRSGAARRSYFMDRC